MSPCPSREALEQFRRGLLPDPDLERVADHLANCARCAGDLGKDSSNDPILATLRRSLHESPLPDEEASAHVADRVSGWVELGRARDRRTAVIEPITPSATKPDVGPPRGDGSSLRVLLVPALAAALALLALAVVIALVV